MLLASHRVRTPLRLLHGSGALLPIIAIATGVALICAFDVAHRGVVAAFGEVVDTMAGRAALQVSTGGDSGQFPEEVAASIAAVPGVTQAIPVVAGSAFLADSSGELLAVHGINLNSARLVGVYEPPSPQRYAAANPMAVMPGTILLTHSLAARRGLKVGAPVTIDTPMGRQELRVAGLMEPLGIGQVVGDALAVTMLRTAQAAFTRPGFINRVDVVLAPDAERDRVAAAIGAVLPAGLKVEAPEQRKADLQRAAGSLRRLLQAVSLVALIEAFLVAFNSLTTSFGRRAWQLGVLQAIGISPRVIRRMLIRESVQLGAVGAAIGLLVGIGVGRMLLPWIAAATALNVAHVVPPARLLVRGTSLGLAAGLGLAAAALAAMLPARRAVALGAAAVIRTRGSEQRAPDRRWIQLGLPAVLTVILAAIGLQEMTRAAGWGLVVTALVPIAIVLGVEPLVEFLLERLEPLVRWLTGPSGSLAVMTLRRSPQRTAFTVATLGIGVGAVLWLGIVAWSFERSVIDAHRSAALADLVISSPHIASGVNAMPVGASLLEQLRAVPGVATVAGNRVVDWHHDGGPIAIDAYDATYFSAMAPGQAQLIGSTGPDVWQRVAAGEAVLISSNFVYNIGGRTGDTLVLETPSGALRVPIAGVISHLWSPRGTVVMSRALYARRWGDASVTRIYVQIEPGADTAAVRAAITRALGNAYDLEVFSGEALIAYFAVQVRRAFAGVDLLSVLILGIVLVAVGDTLGASVVERTWEIGALHAMGVRRRTLRRMVAAEAVLLGVLGLTLATAVGLGLGAFWVTTTFPHLLGWILDWHVPYAWTGAICLLAMTACFLGAWWPARQVSRLEPAVALRQE